VMFSTEELLAMKLKTFEANSPKEKIDSMVKNHGKILFFSSLIENIELLSMGKKPTDKIHCENLSVVDIRNFLINLLCFPALKNYLHFAANKDTKEQRLQVEKNFILVNNFTLSQLSLWEFALNNNLTLARLHDLQNIIAVNDRVNISGSLGQKAYESGFETYSLMDSTDDFGTVEGITINPRAIKRLIDLIIACNEAYLDKKFFSRFGLTDKSNTKALVALYSDLNRALNNPPTSNEAGGLVLNFP